jgi:hypothetical protein
MLRLIKKNLPEVLRAVAPLVGVVCVLQVALVRAPLGLFLQFLAGSSIAVIGMALLFAGIDMGILPMGRFIGAELPQKRSLSLMLGVAFALAFATTIAEPDVLVLASQVQSMSDGALSARLLVSIVGLGVGVFASVALLRVLYGFSMRTLLAVVYSAIIVLSVVAPERVVPLAYDAGSVTTGVLTAPVILALALGINSVLAGRSGVSDGFGYLGLASAGPIIAVLLFGMLW